MRSLFVLIALISSVAFAEGDDSLRNANNQWSYYVAISGISKQDGVSLGFMTPLLWETLGLRVDYSGQRLGVPGADPVTFSAIDAGIKIQLNQASSANIFSYLVENFDFYFPRDAETQGSTVGFETDYGLEIRHHATVWGDRTIDMAAFAEIGLGASDLRARPERGGNSIGDGLVTRLGFRRFF